MSEPGEASGGEGGQSVNGETQPKCQSEACGGQGIARYGAPSYDEPERLCLLCESCAALFHECARLYFLPLDCSDLKWDAEILIRG